MASAYQLIEAENPKGTDQPAIEVASRHALTQGQEIRWRSFRFLLPASIRDRIARLNVTEIAAAKAWIQPGHERATTFVLNNITTSDGTDWVCPEHAPYRGRYNFLWDGLIIKINKTLRVEEFSTFPQLVSEIGDDALIRKVEEERFGFLVLATPKALEAANVGTGGILTSAAMVCTDDEGQREPPSFENLRNKKVGVVGAGSAGSKIMITLARSGVRDFVLVDDDVFLPHNVRRHALSWNSVGESKVDALETQIRLISPNAQVDARRLRLTGQEAASSVSGALVALSKCNLIVDATADPNTLNQLSYIAKRDSRTLVWMQVYAGGIGGMVARHRPHIDPEPHRMRMLFNEVTQSLTDEAPPRAIGKYAAEGEHGEPVIASDADVSIIAHWAAEMALDTLAENEPSRFPFRMYLIGLTRGWAFDEPFHTIPIDVGEPVNESSETDIGDHHKMADFVEHLLKKVKDDHNAAV
ncbi:MAG: ThiF family adenylyltransferase [Candidatus Cybelea sp.]